MATSFDLKKSLVEFSEETSLHGAKYVGKQKSHWIKRFVWGLTVLSMLGVASYMIVENIRRFYNYPSETKTVIRTEGSLEFPAVTICNLNKFRRSAFTDDLQGSALVLKTMFDADQLSPQEIQLVLTFPEFREKETVANFSKLIYGASHQLKDMILEIKWRGQLIENYTDYFSTVLSDEGICYTFHSDLVQKQLGFSLDTTSTGSAGGLWVRMDIQQTDEYFFGPENSAGIKVLVHDPTKFPLVGELGFAVAPGEETFASIKKNEIQSLPPPYEGSICTDTQQSDFKNHLSYFQTYNQPACKLECQTKYVLKKCGCRLYYQPGTDDDLYCSPYDQYTCGNQAIENYTKSQTALEECNCFQECYTTSYGVKVSSASFPAYHLVRQMEHLLGWTEGFIKKNVLEFRVFFEEMNVETIKQSPSYEAGALLADVGGTAGLFMGASLLTVTELLDFLLVTVGLGILLGGKVKKVDHSPTHEKK